MLPQISRLPSCEFRSRGYNTMTTPFFVLKIKKGRTKENKIGIIISAAIIKSATRRNFWKRQTRANFKSLPDAGNDFLIIFSENIKNCTAKEFKEAFLHATKNRVSVVRMGSAEQ
jgi:ribonuclease P protein component